MNFTATLFVPGDRPERFEKALASGADTVIVDLEDAVAGDAKASAREHVRAAFAGGLRAFVRINLPGSSQGKADIEMLRDGATPPHGIVVPKVDLPSDVESVATACPGVPVVAIVESVAGMQNAADIARHPAVTALAFGSFDLCAQLGAVPEPEVMAPYRCMVVLAARSAGKAAIDTPFIAIGDEAGLRADARRARIFGFDGKLAIHPKQVHPIQQTYAPTDAEIAHARKVVEAAGRNDGVVVVDGVMIDAPVVAGARRIMARVSN